MTAPFTPTHAAPATGLDTWPEPDATVPVGPVLAAGLPVQQVEQLGAWSKIVCSNGWVAWVDGRRLEPLPAAAPPPPTPTPVAPPAAVTVPAAVAPAMAVAPVAAGPARPIDRSPMKVGPFTVGMSLVGTAAAVASCFLPWVSINGQGQTAFKVPAQFLIDYQNADPSGIKLGWVLAALAAGSIAVVVRPVQAIVRKGIGWAFVVLATVFVAQYQRVLSDAGAAGIDAGGVLSVLGLGVYLGAAGGLLIALGRGES